MIYLLATGNKKDNPLLKIGFTTNLEKRFKQYYTCNPRSIFLKTREGDEILEAYLHDYFSEFKYPELKEWFYYDEKIIDKFDMVVSEGDYIRWIIQGIKGLSFTESFKRYCLFMDKRNYISFDNNKETEYYRNLYQKLTSKEREQSGYDEKKINIAILEIEGCDIPELRNFLINFYNSGIFSKKMKSYCEFRDKYEKDEKIISLLSEKIRDPKYSNYYQYFGTSRCNTLYYCESSLRDHFISENLETNIALEIKETFDLDEPYTKKFLKEELSKIYKKFNVPRTAKATDFEKYFELVPVKIRQENGKRDHGFKLLPKL